MTYEYECGSCGHRWELDQKITEEPVKECPECRATEARRLVSAGGGFALKGPGWFRDGY